MRAYKVVYFLSLAVMVVSPYASLLNSLSYAVAMWCAGYWYRDSGG